MPENDEHVREDDAHVREVISQAAEDIGASTSSCDSPRDGAARDGLARRTFLHAAGAAGVLAPFATTSGRADDGRLDAEVTTVDKRTRIRAYPTFDADGERTGERTWRTVRGTGNCCENYLAATADGRIADMGGDYLYVTDDDGRTWTRVGPSTAYPATSEGCVSAAPGGDVVAIDWNPYSGDRVIAYKYDANDDAWYYNEVPLNTPFYDRPWFAVFEGPFTVAGEEVPYVTVMKGGWPEEDAVLYVSADGLNYELASSRFLEAEVEGSLESYLDDVPDDADLDWTQPHTVGGFTPLGDGRALTDETAFSARAGFVEAGCEHVLVRDDPAENLDWHCFDTPAGLPDEGRLLADSRGYLHHVHLEIASTFAYRYSTDGGRTWTTERQQLPGNYEVRDDFLLDFKAHGGLATTAVAVHVTDPDAEVDQDIVFRFDGVAPGSDTEVEVLYLGEADVSYVVGVSTEERFDFTTLAILPDGRIAVSFADDEHEDPRIAIEEPGAEPDGPPPTVAGSRSDDGDVFTGGQTNKVDLAVEPSREAIVRDVVPSAWTVLEDYGDVTRVEDAGDVQHVYVGTAPDDETSEFTYFAEAPEGLEETNTYTFGPVEIQAVDGAGWWIAAPDTEDTNTVEGADTEL